MAIILAILLGYVLKKELARNHVASPQKTTEQARGKRPPLPTSSGKPAMPSAKASGEAPKMPTSPSSAHTPAASQQAKQKIDYCTQLENDVRDFFSYLDRKPYIQHLELGKSLLEYSREMVRQLSAHPPVPAGEGINPTILTKNIYHLYRTLGLRGIRLVREILLNEQDSMEINLDILYRWVMEGDKCPDRLRLRPSFDVLYKYAGFLVNTIGGRACLSRRDNRIRLLATYYCLLILHEADRRGVNSYGIDIYPIVVSLKREISHYHDLEFQPEYLQKLTKLENYYIERR